MDKKAAFGNLLAPATFAAMPSGRLPKPQQDQLNELRLELDRQRDLVSQHRRGELTAQIEVLRLNQEIKNRQRVADGLKELNSQLVERMMQLLGASEIKES